ncbi:MAG: hypothetical protein E4G99_11215 [Anaerolineales bacterium]|nr:MAG: hypothetical protein E4G99_11215 [Anaerolineales bacterium]
MNRGRLIMQIGAIGLIISAFLPWISVSNLYGNAPGAEEGIAIGWEGDGFITGGIGLILLVSTFMSKGKAGKRYSIVGAVFGLLACVAIFTDFQAIVKMRPEAGILASTDIGLYLTLVGGIVAIIGGLQMTPSHESGDIGEKQYPQVA